MQLPQVLRTGIFSSELLIFPLRESKPIHFGYLYGKMPLNVSPIQTCVDQTLNNILEHFPFLSPGFLRVKKEWHIHAQNVSIFACDLP